MPYERLLAARRIQAYSASPNEINRLLQVANRDITTAHKNLEYAEDWAYTIAYNAILQVCRALMLQEGYRPRGGEQHATVVEFTEERLGPGFDKQVHLFDQMRRKRHRVVYEVAGLISKTEAEQAITFAQSFIDQIAELITGQQKLMR